MQDTSHLETRANDLVTVDEAAAEAGFVMPVSLTCAAWAECVSWSDDDSRRQLIQSERIRLAHLLRISADAFSLGAVPSSGLLFPVFRVPRDGYTTDASEITLKAAIVTDNGDPFVIIMLQHEG